MARKHITTWMRQERGQSIVVVVISMSLILLLAALAIDASEWFAKRHQAQVAADASALAAANCLATQKCTSTTSGGDASNFANSYASSNGVPASSVTIGGGFVTVTTSTPAPVTFAGLANLAPTASARAVASYDTVTLPDDLFAQDCATPTLLQPVTSASCSVNCAQHGITIATSGNSNLLGTIQTNGSLKITAHPNDHLGDMLYGNPAGSDCSSDNSVSGGTQVYGPPQEEPSFAVFPDTYNTAVATSNCTPPSTYYGSNATASATSSTATTGNSPTYTGSSNISIPSNTSIVNNVVHGTITIGGNWGMTSTPVTMCAWGFTMPNNVNSVQLTSVTLSALPGASGGPSISISGNTFGITPNPNMTPDTGQTGPALAIYDASTTANNPLDMSGTNNDSIVGTVYVPASGIVMGGNNAGLSFWEANTISYNGNNTAGGPVNTVPGLGSDALVQ